MWNILFNVLELFQILEWVMNELRVLEKIESQTTQDFGSSFEINYFNLFNDPLISFGLFVEKIKLHN